MNQTATMDFVADTEDVARILFSPLFISDGILSQKAFIRGGSPQSVGRMLLRMHLVELAQNRIEKF